MNVVIPEVMTSHEFASEDQNELQNANMDEQLDVGNLFDLSETISPDNDETAETIPQMEICFQSSSGRHWSSNPQSNSARGRVAAPNIFSGVPFAVRRGIYPQDEKSFLVFTQTIYWTRL